MKKIFVLCFLAAFLALPAFASAAPKVKIIYKQGKDKVMYKKNQNISFDDTTVDGELIKPQGADFSVRSRAKFNSLIQYRKSFLKEMMKSAKKL
jgi:hypothetical protein